MTDARTEEIIARVLYEEDRHWMPYAHLEWRELGETQTGYLSRARRILAALQDAGKVIVDREGLGAALEVTVLVIAFLERDWGTTRMVDTVPKVIEMLRTSDTALRAMLSQAEKEG